MAKIITIMEKITNRITNKILFLKERVEILILEAILVETSLKEIY